jgi:hypothetical protein
MLLTPGDLAEYGDDFPLGGCDGPESLIEVRHTVLLRQSSDRTDQVGTTQITESPGHREKNGRVLRVMTSVIYANLAASERSGPMSSTASDGQEFTRP